MGLDVSWKGWAALATFALQNGLAILLVRYSKLHDQPYSSQVVVLLQEGVVKLPMSMLVYSWECGGGLLVWLGVRRRGRASVVGNRGVLHGHGCAARHRRPWRGQCLAWRGGLDGMCACCGQ